MELHRVAWDDKEQCWQLTKYDLATGKDILLAKFYDHYRPGYVSPLAEIIVRMLNMLSANMPK